MLWSEASLGSSMDLTFFSEQEKQHHKCTYFHIEVCFLREVFPSISVVFSQDHSRIVVLLLGHAESNQVISREVKCAKEKVRTKWLLRSMK